MTSRDYPLKHSETGIRIAEIEEMVKEVFQRKNINKQAIKRIRMLIREWKRLVRWKADKGSPLAFDIDDVIIENI